jgi:hypothetical protein
MSRHSKLKVRLTLRMERALDLAIRLDAAREKVNRTKWFIEVAKQELYRKGKWP